MLSNVRIVRQTLLRQHHRDGRRQRGLAVIDVTDGADVQVRLIAREFLFCHVSFSSG